MSTKKVTHARIADNPVRHLGHLRELQLAILDRSLATSGCTLTIIYHHDDDRFLIRVFMTSTAITYLLAITTQPQVSQESDGGRMWSSSLVSVLM